MKKSFLYVLGLMAALSISACSNSNQKSNYYYDDNYIDESGSFTEPIDIVTHHENEKPDGEYQEGTVLVKTNRDIRLLNLDLDIKNVE